MIQNPYQTPTAVDGDDFGGLVQASEHDLSGANLRLLRRGFDMIGGGLVSVLVAFASMAAVVADVNRIFTLMVFGFAGSGFLCLSMGTIGFRKLGYPMRALAMLSLIMQLFAVLGFLGLVVRLYRGHPMNGFMQLFAASTTAAFLIAMALIMIITRLTATRLGVSFTARASEVAIVCFATCASTCSLISMRIAQFNDRRLGYLAVAAIAVAMMASVLSVDRIKRHLDRRLQSDPA